MPHLPIRARMALVSAGLAATVLTAGLLTVYLIEAHQVHQTLIADSRAAAHGLAVAGEHRTRTGGGARTPPRSAPASSRGTQTSPPGAGPTTVPVPPPVTEEGDSGAGQTGDARSGSGRVDAALIRTASPGPRGKEDGAVEEQALATYLGARRGSSQVLLYLPATGRALANRSLALALIRHHPAVGRVETVELGGDGYLVAAARRRGGIVLAGLPLSEADAAVRRLLDAMLIVCVVGLVPLTAAAWLVARRALSPLSRIAQRASRVTAGDLSVRMGPVATHDEIGEVATAIDAMLDRLESAFSAQRRFVHDASHELRTPLTIARGHLEVALPHDGGSDDDLRQAIAVAIAELDRMGTLVDSLLRLARAGEGDHADWDTVDVSVLASAAVDRCRILGERSWHVEAPPGATVHGDGAALEQVLVNLLANAVRHTSPGDAIAVRVTVAEDRIEIRVVDTGEGIDPSLLPALFDRFTRADSARSREAGGAGLGLAICQAIVTAHEGTIAAENTPGGGATFVVSLPRSAHRIEVRAASPPAHA